MDGASNGIQVDNCAVNIPGAHEAICWGCGLGLLLPSSTPIYKCGWCGSISNQKTQNPESRCSSYCRVFRDRALLAVIFIFMLFLTCGGFWAAVPFVYSRGYVLFVFHCVLALAFASGTLISFMTLSFCHPGQPPTVQWGNYSVVRKDGLDNYTFCQYCKKPKSPRTHHCRSCKTCVLDMDHHCPFIGNCVGAANHQLFVTFLMWALLSNLYAFIMFVYVGRHFWPPLMYGRDGPVVRIGTPSVGEILSEFFFALVNTASHMTVRGIALMYMAVASFAVEGGIILLLWQQLSLIYEGKTYLDSLTSVDSDGNHSGWHNISIFFGRPFPTSFWRFLLGPSKPVKIHSK